MADKRQSMGRRALGAACALALTVAGAAPAAARPGGPYGYGGGPGWHGHSGGYRGGPYRGGPYWGGYRGYRGGMDAGDVIGIAALIGAVAVIAGAAARDQGSNRDYDRNDSRPYDGNDNRRYDDRASSGNGARSVVSSDDAANACADAARDEAEADNRGYAQILSVDPAQPYGSADGWSVNGRVEQRASAQDRAGVIRRFSCEIEGGRVAHVYLSRDSER